ncbi:MAG: MMPL family transporter, partial [Candidatus Delongbacteria bacterium]|nr:MMPL family transporter [Candidatus Delongbacteria bacterium]
MNIPKFSVNNPVLVNLTMIIIFLLGIYTIMTIPKEAMPQIDLGKFVITVAYPGVAPEEIETLIIDKIEEELADITDIDYISSTAYEGMASIMVNLLPSVDIDKAWNDIGTELDKVKDLPEDASDIMMKNLSMKELKTVCTVAIEGESYTPDALRRIADNIKDDIANVKFVSKVEMKGEKNREIQIDIDKNKLEYYGISFNDIENAIKSKNMNLPGGDIKSGKSEILIRTMGEFENLDQIRFLIIRSLPNGAVIRLRDIAEVVDTYEDVNILTRLNGKESINLYVYQNTDGNILDIVSKIRKYVKTIPGKYTDIKAEIVNDASLEVKSNISTLSSSAVLGIFLVFLTLFIFIGWRNAIFAAMGIPFSFLMTFWIMNFFGITINNLSLFALVLILGMVVDDAIVVIENVHRNIEEGMTPKEAAIKGTQEVMWPVIAAVLTTISAFLPILMMEGNMGKFLSEFPKVVMIALAASLFEALFILPSHLADFSKAHDAKAKHKTKNGFYSKLVNKYSIVLKGFLKKRLLSLTILSIVFAISVSTVVLGFVKFEFFPSSTPKTLVIQVKTLPGNSLAQTDSLTYLLEKKILGLEYKRNFETLNSNIGQMQERRNWEESSNYVELRLDLIDADSLTVEVSTIRKDIREYLETIPEVMSYKFSTEAHGPPTGNDVELRVLGDDLAKLQEHSNKIKKVLSGIQGVTDIEDSFDAGKKEMRIYPDYDKLAINGMTVAELASFIRIASTGKVVSEFTERSDKYDIRIKLQNDQFENVQDVENLKITTRTGKKIYLKDIVRFEINTSLSQIQHRGGRRMIEITANSGMYSDNGKMKKRT